MKKEKLVDLYGRVEEKIRILERKKELLKKKVLELGEGAHIGEKYSLVTTKVITYELSTDQVIEKLGIETYIKCSKCSVEKVRKYIPESELPNYGTARELYRVSTKRITERITE